MTDLTTPYSFPTPVGSTTPPNVPAHMKALADAVAAELAAGTGKRSHGKAINSTAQGRTNTTYGELGTPDRVSVVLPTDGIITIGFQAMVKESVQDTARAAIFIGANQLKVQSIKPASARGPQTQAAGLVNGGANIYTPLFTTPVGLCAASGTTADATADVTTGQVIGAVDTTSGTGYLCHEIGGTLYAGPSEQAGAFAGGLCCVFAAAGTYDVSVQFKAASGTVTAKDRKLWVASEAF